MPSIATPCLHGNRNGKSQRVSYHHPALTGRIDAAFFPSGILPRAGIAVDDSGWNFRVGLSFRRHLKAPALLRERWNVTPPQGARASGPHAAVLSSP